MLTRIISAIVAVVLLVTIYIVWDVQGLYGICTAVALGCAFEYSRLTFRSAHAPLHIQVVYFILTGANYFVAVVSDYYAIYALAIGSILFLSMVLMTIAGSRDLYKALQLQSAGLVGFFYCGLFPALAVRTLFLEKGTTWLFGLLAIVFAGDTFAYLAGRAFGRAKLLEAVSPKKTVEGSLGGLFGSALAGLALWSFFKDIPPLAMVVMAIVTGLFAQIGDLFESLLKRIAEVKDSGSIMPGHGGLLDRVDGVLFAAPVYYVMARLLV